MKTLQPGAVPLPPLDPKYVYPPENPRARAFLTNLPAPSRTRDGYVTCMYCSGRVEASVVVTHVPGASPVRMTESHICRSGSHV